MVISLHSLIFGTMETKDLWLKITSQPKWYASIRNKHGSFYNAQMAFKMKQRFAAGTLTSEIVEHIFKQCGYTKLPDKWVSTPTIEKRPRGV